MRQRGGRTAHRSGAENVVTNLIFQQNIVYETNERDGLIDLQGSGIGA